MDIILVDTITEELVTSFKKIIPLLNNNQVAPTSEYLQSILDNEGVYLFIAKENNKIYGTITLATYKIPTGLKGWIEDVVVDEEARGKGVGKLLVTHVLDFSRAIGLKCVDLTSRSSREAANVLYKKIGFLKRETNVYRYEL